MIDNLIKGTTLLIKKVSQAPTMTQNFKVVFMASMPEKSQAYLPTTNKAYKGHLGQNKADNTTWHF